MIGEHTITEYGLPRNAKVSRIIRNGQWSWPWSSLGVLHDIRQAIIHLPPPLCNSQDSLNWLPDSSGKFSICSAWEHTRTRSDKKLWCSLIWHPGRIPKAAFCLWLAVNVRLETRDRLHFAIPDLNCLLCSNFQENHDHLFFNSRVSDFIWRQVKRRCGIDVPHLDWTSLVDWMSRRWKNSTLSTIAWKLSLANTVYYLWHERNHRLHTGQTNNIPRILENIIGTVKWKLSLMKGVRDTEDNRATQVRWDLPQTIYDK